MTKCYLNDFGVVCSLGNTKQQVKNALLTDTQQEYLTENNQLHHEGKSVFVGSVNSELPCLAHLAKPYQTRNNALALQALEQILPTIEQLKSEIVQSGRAQPRIAVVIGTSTSGIAQGEQARRFADDDDTAVIDANYHYQSQEMYAPAQFIAELLGATGPVYSISTACSSSAKALASAQMLLASDLADMVICGGVDSLCKLTINGFSALESISDTWCNPFGENRDGINIGEAAALFVATKITAKVSLLAAGESSDAYHVSAPQPEGFGAIAAMRAALAQANLSPDDIGYINLHGTGTVKNDQMESQAIFQLFGDQVPASSTKRFTGHTLGAAGALEAGFCWLLLSEKSTTRLPVNKMSAERDSALAAIDLVIENNSEPRTQKLNVCLSNSFAFGGNNICLILAKHQLGKHNE